MDQLKTSKSKAFTHMCDILDLKSNNSHKTKSGLIQIYKLKHPMVVFFCKKTSAQTMGMDSMNLYTIENQPRGSSKKS